MNTLQKSTFRLLIAMITALVLAMSNTPQAMASTTSLPSWAPTGLNAPFDPATGMFNLKADNTVRTRASLANAPGSQQNHVFVGDSITSGWNSFDGVAGGTIDRDKSFPYAYRRALNAKMDIPAESSTGLVRAFELNGITTMHMDGRWSPAPNGLTVQAKGHFMYLNSGTMSFNSAASNFTPISGDTASVTYVDTGTFNVTIDDGAPITVVGGHTGKVKRFVKTGLEFKPHKIDISTGLFVYTHIVGAEVYSSKGIAASNVAQGGSRVTGDAQNDWSLGGSLDTSMSGTFSSAAGYSSPPSTVFITLGANDLGYNADNLGAIRDGILETARFYKDSDIVIVAQTHGSQAFSTVDIKPLLTMLYQMSYDNNWPLWDLEHFLGGYEKLAAQGYTGDGYGHLNPAGYKLMGDTLANIIANVPR